jgi:hypothetical protein
MANAGNSARADVWRREHAGLAQAGPQCSLEGGCSYISEEEGCFALNRDDGRCYLAQEFRHPEDKAIEAALIRCVKHPSVASRQEGSRGDWRTGRINRQREEPTRLILNVRTTTLADAKVNSRIASYAALKGDFAAWACVERVSKDFKKFFLADRPVQAKHRRAQASYVHGIPRLLAISGCPVPGGVGLLLTHVGAGLGFAVPTLALEMIDTSREI